MWKKKKLNENLQRTRGNDKLKETTVAIVGGRMEEITNKKSDSRLDFSVKAYVALVLKGAHFEKTTVIYLLKASKFKKQL